MTRLEWDSTTDEAERSATRKTLGRAALRVLTRLVRTRWRSPRAMLQGRIKSLLARGDRGFLLRILRDHAFAMALAALIATGGMVNAAPAATVELSDVAAGDGGFVINGETAGDRSGYHVSGAGDVNGDGLDDVIVLGGADVAVVFGKANGTPVDVSTDSMGTQGFLITRESTGDGGGAGHCETQGATKISGAGDVDGDGLADLIVGGYCDGAYVVFGKADGTTVNLWTVTAGVGGFGLIDSRGNTVSGAGDVNGDGFADVIVGFPGGRSSGHAHVVFGPNGSGGFSLRSETDNPGMTVSGGGDINGDGLDDVIVGACYECGRSGHTYVVFGKADEAEIDLSAVAAGEGGFLVNGNGFNDMDGPPVSGAGDVNGDGLADLIIGIEFATAPNAGESYVVFGKEDGDTVELTDVSAGIGGFVVRGIDASDLSGASVSGAGDVNGDGLDDVIVGARGGDPGGRDNAGESYVVFGKPDTTAVSLSEVSAGAGGFVINGIDAGDSTGRSVSDAGDVNGDGLPDVIVGAWGGDPGGKDNAGESYVVFSPFSPPPPEFVRGDCNGDGEVDLSDAVCTLDWLFVGKATPGCIAALNTNGDEVVDLSDATYLLNFLFVGTAPPPVPFPDCGPGGLEVDNELGCQAPQEICQ
ncbi:MAG: hypothetical protein CMJ48_11805 [Planctomycetaceae bacterium]|nr:hypothetical protein [Planctomycetaceae bacterium]